MISLRSVLSEGELHAMAIGRQRRAMEDLADLTHDGFWRTDARGRLVEVSPKLAEMLGRGSEEVQGRRVQELDGFWSDDPAAG